jgi:outer membrane protein OmpA-like peptidoglycan-associated protein
MMNLFTLTRSFFCFALLLCNIGLSAQGLNNLVKLEVKNERAINTKALEFSPAFFTDGIVYVSSDSKGNEKMEDRAINMNTMTIFMAKRDSAGNLTAPQVLSKELTSKYHEGPVSFDKTTEQMFFTRNIVVGGEEKIAQDGEQKSRIYTTTKINGTWGEPFALPFNNNEFDDYHPSINHSGDKLYFSSSRPGGFGGMDLYVSIKEGNMWGVPVNLGPKVNTKGNEIFPFIHPDNSLYFASNGHTGAGGLDLFFTKEEGTKWTAPFNLGAPFNTNGDDFGLIVDLDKRNGYFTSNGTPDGAGADEILSFHTKDGNLDQYLNQGTRLAIAPQDLVINVIDKATGLPLPNSMVRIFSMDQNKVLGRDADGNLITLQQVNGEYVMKVAPSDQGINGVTNKAGRFSTDIKPATYVMIASQPGYQTKQIIKEVTLSNREYTIPLEKSNGTEWNTVLLDQNNEPLRGTTVVLTNPNTGKRDTVNTDPSGTVNYSMEGQTPYTVDVYRDGKPISTQQVNPQNPTGITSVNVKETPLRTGSVIELPNIYYNFNDASLRPEASQDLAAVLLLMQQYPSLRIELGSHTDCRGTNLYNDDLSSRRAKSVVKYLTDRGIAADRLEARGYGETQLKNQCADGVSCTETEQARNRRTELRVLSGADGVGVRYVDSGSLGLDIPVNSMTAAAPKDYFSQNSSFITSSSRSINGTSYAVIVGSFQIESGAYFQLNRIKNLGYSDAVIKHIKGSPNHSVVAAQCNSMNEARALVRKFTAKDQIPAYILVER